ncbi:MAG TPA: pyridoxamine 5'-phosphate oxidase family protein [Mycobacteriales bacterium]|nr:pyridoxamine 5'-phosphate oxidase family protein [Mycobacteriales bacterium]
MAKVYDGIDGKLARWLERQPVFFVATAPLAGDGHVNLSPKGTLGTFRVLGPSSVAYLDLTGSGAETLAHLRENGRITLMFCAFDGPPNIVRLSGTGVPVLPSAPSFASLVAGFPAHPGVRSVIEVSVSRVSDSCGYSVPRMSLESERDILDQHNARKGSARLASYRIEKNAHSIDGLPGWPVDEPAVPQ